MKTVTLTERLFRELLKEAFSCGWEKRGSACYPTPQDWEEPLAWEQFEEVLDKTRKEFSDKKGT